MNEQQSPSGRQAPVRRLTPEEFREQLARVWAEVARALADPELVRDARRRAHERNRERG